MMNIAISMIFCLTYKLANYSNKQFSFSYVNNVLEHNKSRINQPTQSTLGHVRTVGTEQ